MALILTVEPYHSSNSFLSVLLTSLPRAFRTRETGQKGADEAYCQGMFCSVALSAKRLADRCAKKTTTKPSTKKAQAKKTEKPTTKTATKKTAAPKKTAAKPKANTAKPRKASASAVCCHCLHRAVRCC